ncbi:MAG: hypothetical protein PHQ00_02765 [Phycisphaerae bacterium]|nr:hypothetical protein [Phycisphaerae bacterium]
MTAAEIPLAAGNVSSNGFTRIDFCNADGLLYAFNGKNLYRYSISTDSFEIAFSDAGSVISDMWDPSDIAFLTDCNNAILPTGESMKTVYADRQQGIAAEKIGLRRNYYSTASRYRDNQLFANGVGSQNNTIYLLDINFNGIETEVVQVSNNNSGAIAFDFADNLYLADFKPIFDGNRLGQVDIYRISRQQLDSFIEDGNFVVVPQLIVNNIILAGSDSMVIDADYNIYMGSYVGIAKIIPTDDPDNFAASTVDGDIYAPPYGFPWPLFRFCGIAADIRNGIIYYGISELNEQTYVYSPYTLQSFQSVAADNWSADLNGDGIVDFCDLFLFQEDFLCSGQYLKGDINDDNFVDFQDFAIFAGRWQNNAPWYKED